jgi:hypothetical protein
VKKKEKFRRKKKKQMKKKKKRKVFARSADMWKGAKKRAAV